MVDCLLPSQVRKLGQNLTYLAPRRAIKTAARDCEIRGGEYVSYDRANYATALKVWLEPAKQGDAAAQTYVGEIYEKGLGLQPDYQLAAHWYSQAAEQGYARAQINLGYLYEKGLGVQQDITSALNWYRKASGLSDGELEFASSVEIASRQAQAQELASLRQEVKVQDQQAEALRSQLETAEQQLGRRQNELALAEKDREALRVALADQRQGARSPAQASTGVANPTDATRTTDLEAERRRLTERETEAAEQQKQLIQKLQAAEEEQRQLREQLEGEREQARSLRQQLTQQQEDLAKRRNTLAQAERERDQAREALTRLQASQQSATEVSEETQRLARVLADHEAMVETQRQEMAWLETEIAQQRELLSKDIAQVQAREQTLQQSLDARGQEIASLQSELNQAQAALAESQRQLKARDAQIAKAQQELQAERERAAQQEQQASAAAATKTQELEAKLRQREAEIAKQESAIQQLQVSIQEQKSQVTSLPPATEIALAPIGPTIEIIEPPLALTRGIPSITLRAPVPELEIIGRVSTPDSLMTFRVNDLPASVGEDGLFKVRMPVKEAETPVSVVAVDKSGHRAAVDFMLIPAMQKKQAEKAQASLAPTAPPTVEVEFGDYHALVIGNNEYLHMPNLSTAANDARAVGQVLRDKYRFKTEVLVNADRYSILSALNRYRETLTENDNLLIYYAGHGELDATNQRGHWLPVDAEPDSTANWISNVAITDILNVMSAKHILVVADSCYSGAMTRASLARLPAGMTDDARVKWFKAMAKTRTRAVLTSGGVEPVLDAGGGEHSVFAKAFLEVLRTNDQILEGWRLYQAVREQVKRAAFAFRVDQDPQYAPIQYAGHEAGEFLFLPGRIADLATLHGDNIATRGTSDRRGQPALFVASIGR
ncbi:MAG: caspase family protein [Gammaproteobacteria bacterium]